MRLNACRRRHALIPGRLTQAAGPSPIGSEYWANELTAFGWVHATLTETALLARPRTAADLRRRAGGLLYREQALCGSFRHS